MSLEDTKWHKYFKKQFDSFLNICLLYSPVILLPRCFPKRNKNIMSSTQMVRNQKNEKPRCLWTGEWTKCDMFIDCNAAWQQKEWGANPHNTNESPKWKKPQAKGKMLNDVIYQAFWKMQSYSLSGNGVEREYDYKGAKGNFWGGKNLTPWLWWWLRDSIHVSKQLEVYILKGKNLTVHKHT